MKTDYVLIKTAAEKTGVSEREIVHLALEKVIKLFVFGKGWKAVPERALEGVFNHSEYTHISNSAILDDPDQPHKWTIDMFTVYRSDLAKINTSQEGQGSSVALPFMSKELSIAVACSKKLYPSGYKQTDKKPKKMRDEESKKINDYLKNIDLSGRKKDAIRKVVNPVP